MTTSEKWKYLYQKTDLIDPHAILSVILQNRGLTDEAAIQYFLHPDLSMVTVDTVNMNKKDLISALDRLREAKEKKEEIVVFGDYDVDGITGTAILWETLYSIGFHVFPFIPNRLDEGYGLSVKGIEHILNEKPDTKLIITVDNGIVAHEAVSYAKKKGIDVIITDHHIPTENVPDAYATLHTTYICGAGVAWIFCQELLKRYPGIYFFQKEGYEHLSLVALATVADLVPLTGSNRILLTFGLKTLQTTKRPGLQALFEKTNLVQDTISVYTIGHVIAPRLNAMGRLESAMDSLRLLCTKDTKRANVLAEKLNVTNKNRQQLTQMAGDEARNVVLRMKKKKKLLFVASEKYEEGIIGLIAGKLVETFYLPSIVLSKGKEVSKGSARSISGFNIIQFIRGAEHLLINAGGHPMAAGFTVKSKDLKKLQDFFEKHAEGKVFEEMLIRQLPVDATIPLQAVTQKLYEILSTLAPFGHKNPEPLFASEVIVRSISAIGTEKQHLKMKVAQEKLSYALDAIAFGMGGANIQEGDTVTIAYIIDENNWNGKKNLQLKVRDINYNRKNTEI